MCKLAGWTSGELIPLQERFADAAVKAAAKEIRATERDGFGFAQHGVRGLRDRFFNPADFQELAMLPNFKSRYGAAARVFSIERTTEHAGSYKPTASMVIHGRTATTEKNLANVHPFRREGWTLAHNGVVSYNGVQTPDHAAVTCDSQHLLLCFSKHNGNRDLVKEDLKNISGYAAFMCLAPDGTMIVARDSTANLYAGVTSRGRWIFGTTAAIVTAIADSWECKGVTPLLMDPWTWLEFAPGAVDPVVSSWDHAAYTSSQAAYASKSLGREITTYANTGAGDFRTTATGYAAGTTVHAKREAVTIESVEEAQITPITVSDLYCMAPEVLTERRFFRVFPEEEAAKVADEEKRLKERPAGATQVWFATEAFTQFTPEDIYNVEETELHGGTGLIQITESYYTEEESQLIDSLEALDAMDGEEYDAAISVYQDAVRGQPNCYGASAEFKQEAIDTLPEGMRFIRTEETIWSNVFDGHRFAKSPTTNGWVALVNWSGMNALGAGPRVYATDLPLTFTQKESCRKAALAWAKNRARQKKKGASA